MRARRENLYAVLGVARTATMAELRQAYHHLALQVHPDVAGPGSTEAFQLLAEAYRVLSDPVLRAEYDGHTPGQSQARAHGRRPWERPSAGGDSDTPYSPGGGEFVGMGGRFTWEARTPRARADRIERLSGALDDLVARAVARRDHEGVLELLVSSVEAAAGGTAEIDTRADVACPTCYGGARPGGVWCRRCEYAGTVAEVVTACVELPAGVTDGAYFRVPLDPSGHTPPLRIRVRVQ